MIDVNEAKNLLMQALQSPKSVLVVGGTNGAAVVADYLEWLPHTDLTKASIMVTILLGIPLILRIGCGFVEKVTSYGARGWNFV